MPSVTVTSLIDRMGAKLVLAVAVLLPGAGSVSVAETVAELTRGPVAPGFTAATTMIVTLPPLAIEPRLHTAPAQVPWLGVAETSVTPPGRVSATCTLVAVSGPLLVTVRL